MLTSRTWRIRPAWPPSSAYAVGAVTVATMGAVVIIAETAAARDAAAFRIIIG
jgi:hypothetical protein